MNALVDAARKRFLESPEDPARRRRMLDACLEAGDADTLFVAAAKVLEQGLVRAPSAPGFGAWLMEAMIWIAQKQGGSGGSRAFLRAARLGHLLKQPQEELKRLVIRARQMEDSPSLSRAALDLLGEFSPADERLTWLDSAVLEAGSRAERLDLARQGVEAAEDLGKVGAARRWAELAAREDPSWTEKEAELSILVQEEMVRCGEQEERARSLGTRRAQSRALSSLVEDLWDLSPEDPRIVELAREAYDLAPGEPARVLLVAEIHRGRGELDEVREHFLEVLVHTERRDLRLLAHRKLAELYRGPLSDPNRAEKHLRKVLDIDPADEDAFDIIAQVCRTSGDLELLVELLEAALRQNLPKTRNIKLLNELGRLLWHELHDLERAADVYRRLRSLAPRNLEALGFFEHCYEKDGDWKRLYNTLSQRLSLEISDVGRASVAKRMAMLAGSELEDRERALESWKRALRYAPDDPEVQQAISELYHETGKWYALVDFLNAQIQSTPEDDVDRKVALLFRLIEIYQNAEKIPSDGMVVKTYRRIVDVSPNNVTALDSLAQKYEDRNRWRDLVQVLQRRIEVTEEADDLLRLFQQVASLWIERMANPSQAIPFLERIMEIDPDNLDVVRKLREIYRAKHNIEKLYQAYERELVLESDGEAREQILVELAMLAQTRLHDPERALRYWEQVLELDPENSQALGALWSLYTQYERWDGMLVLVDRLLSRSDLSRKRRIELLERKGRILSEYKHDLEAVQPVYKEILAIAPANTSARSALQGIYLECRDWKSLEELFTERHDWNGYVHWLDDSARRADDVELICDINREAARILESHLGDIPRAAERMARIVEHRGDDLFAARWLLEHSDQADRLSDRRALIDLILEHTEDTEERVLMLELAARLAIDDGEALPALQYGSQRMVLEATEYGTPTEIEHLVDLAMEAGAADLLVDSLDRARGVLVDREDQYRYRRVAAQVLTEAFTDPDEAIARWQAILDEQPGDEEALDALEGLLKGARRWQELEAILRFKLENAEGAQKDAFFRQLATLYEDVLEDPVAALEMLRGSEALFPEDPEIRTSIRRILRVEERYEELVGLLERDAASEEGALRSRILMEVLELKAGPLNAPEEALALIEGLLVDAPGFKEKLEQQLLFLMEGSEVSLPAARVLLGLRQDSGNTDALVDVLEFLRNAEPEPRARKEVTLSLVDVLNTRVGDFPAALALCRDLILEFSPDAQLLDLAERLIDESGSDEDGVDLFREIIDTFAHDVFVVSDLRRRLARVLRRDPRRLKEAAEVLSAILEEDDEDLQVAHDLEEVLVESGDAESLADFYRKRVDLALDTDSKVDLYLKICELLRGPLGRPEESIEYYRSILDIDESHPGALSSLDQIFQSHQRWEDLVNLVHRKIDLEAAPRELASLHTRVAQLARFELGDSMRALESLALAVELAPDYDEAVALLEKMVADREHPDFEFIAGRALEVMIPLYRQVSDWKRVVELHILEAELEDDRVQKAQKYLRIGSVWQERLVDEMEARKAYLEAMELDPDDQEITHLARTSSLEQEALQPYIGLLERLLAQERFGNPAPRHLEVAALYDTHLGHREKALEHYGAVLELEPFHPEALWASDRLYEAAGEDSIRVSGLERLAEVVPTTHDRMEVHGRLSVVAERLGDTERMLKSLRFIADHPEATTLERVQDALEIMSDKYRADERYTDEREVLDRLVDLTPDVDEKSVLLVRAAGASQEAGNYEGAVERLQKRVDLEPALVQPWLDIERLVGESGSPEELVGILESQSRALEKGVAREEAVLRLVDLLRGDLARYRDVLAAVEMLLNEDTSEETLDELVARLDDPNIAPIVGPPLADFFAEKELPAKEANIWEWLLENFSEELEGDKPRRRLVHLYSGPIKNPEGTVQNAVSLLAVDPYDSVMRTGLAEALALEPDYLALADSTMESHIEDASVEHQSVCRTIIAEAAFGHHKLQEAEEIYRRILVDQPRELDTLIALEEVLQTAEDWSGLATALEKHIDLVHETPETEIEIRMRLSGVRRFGLQDLHGAEDSLRQVLLHDPRHQEAFADLCDILEQRHDKAAKADLYQQRVLVAEAAEKIFLRIELLTLLADSLGDTVGAQEHALALLEEAGSDPKARTFVSELYRNSPDTRSALHKPLFDALVSDGRYGEADQILSLVLQVEQSNEMRASFWREQLSIRREKLDNHEAALKSAVSLLSEFPEEIDVLELALGLVAEQGREEEARVINSLHEIAVDGAMPDLVRAEFSTRVAIREVELGFYDQALALYRTAYRSAPSEEGYADVALAFCREQGLQEDLVEILGELADRAWPTARAQRFLVEAAEIYADQLEQKPKAAFALGRIFELDPRDDRVAGRLYGVLKDISDFAALARFLETRAQNLNEVAKRIEAWREAAAVRRDELGQVSEAREAMSQAYKEAVSDFRVFDEYESILEMLGDSEAMDALYRTELTRGVGRGDDGQRLRSIKLRHASLLDEQLARSKDASVLYWQVVEEQPDSFSALDSLAKIYLGGEQWEQLLSVYEHRLSHVTMNRDIIDTNLKMAAILWERLGRTEEAVDHYRRVIDIDDGNEEAVRGLEQMLDEGASVAHIASILEPIYVADKEVDSLCDLLTRQLDAARTRDDRQRIQMRLGDLFSDRDPQAAIGALASAVADGAEPEDTLKRIRDLAHSARIPEHAAQELRSAADVARGPENRILILRHASELYAEELGNRHEAAEILELARLDAPSDKSIMESLADLYRALGHAEELQSVLQALEEHVKEDSFERYEEVRLERAMILHEFLASDVESARILREILLENPECDEAQRLLESLASDPQVFTSARELLEPAFLARKEYERLVRLYQRGAQDGLPDETRAELFFTSGELLIDRVRDPERGLHAFLDSLMAYPYQPDLLDRVIALVESAGLLNPLRDRLLKLLEAGIPSVQEISLRLLLARHAASVEELEAQLRPVLDLSPERADVLDALLDAFVRAERQEDIVEMCARKLDLPLASAERLDTLRVMARAQLSRGDYAKAEPLWTEVVELDDKDVEAFHALEQIHRQTENTESLVESLERQADATEDHERYVDLKLEAATLWAEQLNNFEAAIANLEDALDKNSERTEVVEQLELLYRTTGFSNRLYDLLAMRLKGISDPERRHKLLTEMGRLAAEDLGRGEEALGLYREAFDYDVHDKRVVTALKNLYREQNRHRELLGIHQQRLSRSPDAGQQVEILSDLIFDRLACGETALSMEGDAERLLALDGSNSVAMGLLGDLRVEQSRWNEALELYRGLLNGDLSAEEEAVVHRKMGRILKNELKRDDEATEHFLAVLHLEPGDMEALGDIEQAYDETGAHDQLVEILSTSLAETTDSQQRLKLLCRLARIQFEYYADLEAFWRYIGEARQIRADDPEVVTLLITVYEAEENNKELIPLLSWYVNYLEAQREYRKAADFALQLAQHFMKLDTWDEAAVYSKMATRYDPDNPAPMLTYCSVLEHEREWDLALKVYQGILMLGGRIDDPMLRADVLCRMANICHQQRDNTRAKKYLERCLAIAADHVEAQELFKVLQ